MSKTILVVGGGIAGLAAGCYGQMNGYETHIFELHDKPGGLCTAWKRKDYIFDGCIHWLVGSGAGSSFNRIWQELGAVQGREFVDHEEFVRVEGEDGRSLIVYTDLHRLEQHMKELAPADAAPIEELCRTARRFAGGSDAFMGGVGEGFLNRIRAGVSMLSLLPALRRYARLTVEDFAARFQDPFLRQALSDVFSLPDFPMLAMLFTLAWMHNRDAGYPIGGSLAFARGIEQRYRELGGTLHYRARVERILVEDGRAVGVRLAGGTEHRGDVVISAADGHATIFDMLEGRYADDRIRSYYEELPIFQPVVQVSLGVARDLSSEPHAVNCLLSPPITVAGKEERRMSVRHLAYDPTQAPPGKSTVIVMFESSYAPWKELAEERERYDAEKQSIALAVMDRLDERWPGFKKDVEVVDVATPLTYVRYTNNWQGSMEGWLITPETMRMTMGKGMPKTLPGLENFYMAGQWVEPGGGVPTAAMSGRSIMQRICKEDGKRFQAHVP
jgi:phytoene dehydrogenase-like protein